MAIADKDNYFILHILSTLSEDGKELVSTSSKCRHTVRGIIYRDVESNQYGFVSSVFVSRWLPVSKVLMVLMEVVLETDSNGLTKLSARANSTWRLRLQTTTIVRRALMKLQSVLMTNSMKWKK